MSCLKVTNDNKNKNKTIFQVDTACSQVSTGIFNVSTGIYNVFFFQETKFIQKKA